MKTAGTNRKVSFRNTIVTCSPAYMLAKRRIVSDSGRARWLTISIGIINGADLKFTGTVRRVDAELIKLNLQNHEIVLIPPLGYSPTGEVFNLSSVEVATHVAVGLQADKLLFLMSENGFKDKKGRVIQHL